MIHYRVVGHDPDQLSNFTGTSLYELKKAIMSENQLKSPISRLTLSAGKPGAEKHNLYDLQKDFKLGKSFDFRSFVEEYLIDDNNPTDIIIQV